MPYGTVNADLMTTSDGVSSSGLYGFKNRIINGAMVVSQRNGTSAVTNPNQYVIDRFYSASLTATNTGQQTTTVPTGFVNSFAYSVGATTGTPAAGNNVYLSQVIEANNVSDLGLGTASASTVTVSFWVRASVTGTYCLALTNGGANNNSTAATRSYVTTYSISTANTWTQITKTVALDTSGTWNSGGSGIGLTCVFDLGSGSNRQTSTLNAWQTGDFCSNSSQVNINATANATFYITGVQLEKGSVATSFDYRPYGTELALCQRYFETSNGAGGIAINSDSFVTTTTLDYRGFQFKVGKRTTPTMGPLLIAGGTGATYGGFNQASFYLGTANNMPSTFGWTASAEL